MKCLTPAALLAAGALLLSGCGSDDGGSTSPFPTPTTAVVPSTELSGTGVGARTGTAGPAPATTATESTVAVLDAQSTAWFDALCTEIAPITAVQNLGDESPGEDAAARRRDN